LVLCRYLPDSKTKKNRTQDGKRELQNTAIIFNKSAGLKTAGYDYYATSDEITQVSLGKKASMVQPAVKKPRFSALSSIRLKHPEVGKPGFSGQTKCL
jgi:hypothetical protein